VGRGKIKGDGEMKKTRIIKIILVFLILLGCMSVSGAFSELLRDVRTTNQRTNNIEGAVKAGNNADRLISESWKIVPTIKKEIDQNIPRSGKVFSKEYQLSDDPYYGINIVVIKYDKTNYLIKEPSGDGEAVRDLKKERQLHLRVKKGEHRGDIYVPNEGYQYYPYSVRTIGQQKCLVIYCFNPSGGTYEISYTTFQNELVKEIIFYVQDDMIRPVTGVGGNIALVMGFKKERQKAIREMDALVKAIF
jgi:hypothetical protein